MTLEGIKGRQATIVFARMETGKDYLNPHRVLKVTMEKLEAMKIPFQMLTYADGTVLRSRGRSTSRTCPRGTSRRLKGGPAHGGWRGHWRQVVEVQHQGWLRRGVLDGSDFCTQVGRPTPEEPGPTLLKFGGPLMSSYSITVRDTWKSMQ